MEKDAKAPVAEKYIRCGECCYAQEADDPQKVLCPTHGLVFKTNSCIRRKAK